VVVAVLTTTTTRGIVEGLTRCENQTFRRRGSSGCTYAWLGVAESAIKKFVGISSEKREVSERERDYVVSPLAE
jgi:hypothetical protein